MTVIIDYGIGNVFSVQRSLEKCGDKKVKLSSDPEDILNADRVVLPGVGAFKDGMEGLKKRNLIEPILECIEAGKPFLGICLGMQMLASKSMEFGTYDGLNLIPGEVETIITNENPCKKSIKIPFIGWAKLDIENTELPYNILSQFDKEYVYLVHSYHVKTKDTKHTIASYNYSGVEITAAIQKQNIIGLQFHPEKSGEAGLDILRKFVTM
jgi:imidazole glycerol-phosphate synthase subunit HisH